MPLIVDTVAAYWMNEGAHPLGSIVPMTRVPANQRHPGSPAHEEVAVSVPPSGQQYEIRLGDQHASVVEVGGGIREYRVGARDVLDPYPLDSMCVGAHGTPLIPWPNRLADGQYRFDGQDHQTALTEPDKHNAIHGFLRWRSWDGIHHEEHRVVMTTTLHPMPDYPSTLRVEVAYELTPDGLVVTTTAENRGNRPCPYGCGSHPYLSPGDGLIDDCTLQLDASTRITTDAVRQLPTGTEAVDGTAFDFRTPRRIGDLEVDFAFTDLTRDDSGRAWTRLTGGDGAEVALWVDRHHPYVEIYTGDTLPSDSRRRGLGTEPMTCPPNAFATGEDVIRLEPGASFTSSWGVTLNT